MPGPGGGAHGGGGSRGGGGNFGGSRGGFSGGNRGGFNGGHHTPPPHHGGGFHGPHFGGGWHHRPFFGGGWYRRPHYGGGGCFGGVFTLILVGFFILFALLFIIPSNTNISINNADSTVYDENIFQDYADKQYRDEFGKSTAYEDNILLVFLTEDDNYYDYYYIAWVGDHITSEINYLFGNENTEFGISVANNININSYKYSLDSNIANIVNEMQDEIISKSLDSSFSCSEDHLQVKSHLTNKTTMDISEDTVNTSLQNFTEKTGIPIVVIVDDIDDVFESTDTNAVSVTKSNNGIYIIIGIIVIVAVALISVTIYVSKKRKKELENDNL